MRISEWSSDVCSSDLWSVVFVGNFLGALTVAVLMAIVFTYGFSIPAGKVGDVISHIGENRTLGYKEYGAAGMPTLFIRGVLCNWMVSLGVVGAMISTTVSGTVIAMWMPVMLLDRKSTRLNSSTYCA